MLPNPPSDRVLWIQRGDVMIAPNRSNPKCQEKIMDSSESKSFNFLKRKSKMFCFTFSLRAHQGKSYVARTSVPSVTAFSKAAPQV